MPSADLELGALRRRADSNIVPISEIPKVGEEYGGQVLVE